MSSKIGNHHRDQINLFQKKIEFRLDHDDQKRNDDTNGRQGGNGFQNEANDSQMKQFEENEFEFTPNSACKKTAVFQNVKMADYKEKGSTSDKLTQNSR